MNLLFITRKLDRRDTRTGFVFDWITELARQLADTRRSSASGNTRINAEKYQWGSAFREADNSRESAGRLYVVCQELGDSSGLAGNIEIHSLGKEKAYGKLRQGYELIVNCYKFGRKADGFFCHMMPIYAIVAWLPAKLLGKKLVLWYTHKSVDTKLKLATTLVDRVLTASKESFRLNTPKVRVVGHGIPVNKFTGADTRRSSAFGKTQKNADRELLYPDISYQIRGACFAVWKELRGAFKENIVEKSLIEELRSRGLSVETQKRIPVHYNGKKVGEYVPDMIVEDKVIIELKSKTYISKEDEKQFWLYLKGSDYRLGFLINFGRELDIRRKVYDTARDNQRQSAYREADHPRKSAFEILSIGRISRVKDYETLIKAVEILVNDKGIKNIKCDIYGDPALQEDFAYLQSLREFVKTAGLEDVVEFKGGVSYDEVAQILTGQYLRESAYREADNQRVSAKYDLFVNLSATGSIDKTVLEAAASKTLAISSNEAYITPLTPISPLLTFERNNPRDLAEKIMKLRQLPPEQRAEIADKLYTWVKNEHNLDSLASKIIQEFSS